MSETNSSEHVDGLGRSLPLCLAVVAMFVTSITSWIDDGGAKRVQEFSGAHRELAARLPMSDFERDWSNLVHGIIVDDDGNPVAGAKIQIYSLDEIDRAVVEASVGEWPLPQASHSAFVDDQGSFAFTSVAYGGLYVVAFAEGYRTSVQSNVSVWDGNSKELSIRLVPELPARLLLSEPDGSIAAGVATLLLPPAWGLPPLQLEASDSGTLIVPVLYQGLDGWVELLVDDPPVSMRVQVGDEETHLPLPPRSDLSFSVMAGTLSGQSVVEIRPLGAQRFGSRSRVLESTDGVCVWPNVRYGEFGILLKHEGANGMRWLKHDGGMQHVAIGTLGSRRVEVLDEDAQLLPARAEWKPESWPVSVAQNGETPLKLIEGVTSVWLPAALSQDGTSFFEGLPAGPGVLRVQTHLGGVVNQRAQDLGALTQVVIYGVPTLVKGWARLPFMSALIEVGGRNFRTRCDAAASFRLREAEGPLVVTLEEPGGGIRYPAGFWITGDELTVNCLEYRRREKSCIYGFVLSEETMQPADGYLVLRSEVGKVVEETRTSTAGFYLFVGLEQGRYTLSLKNAEVPLEERVATEQTYSIECDPESLRKESIRKDFILSTITND